MSRYNYDEKHQDYLDNRKCALRYQRRYYRENKDLISKKAKQRYQDNKDKILAQVTEYRQKNRDKINRRKRPAMRKYMSKRREQQKLERELAKNRYYKRELLKLEQIQQELQLQQLRREKTWETF